MPITLSETVYFLNLRAINRHMQFVVCLLFPWSIFNPDRAHIVMAIFSLRGALQTFASLQMISVSQFAAVR